MTAILYANVNIETSADSQLDRLRAHAGERGLPVAREVVERAHGPRAGRPRLRAVLAGAAKKDVIIAVTVAVVANSARALEVIVASIREKGASLMLLDERIDTTAGIEGAMTVVSSLAELERRRAHDRAVEGQRRAKAEGRQIGRASVAPPGLGERARALREQGGLSWRLIGRELGVADRTARRAVAKTYMAGGSPASNEKGGGA